MIRLDWMFGFFAVQSYHRGGTEPSPESCIIRGKELLRAFEPRPHACSISLLHVRLEQGARHRLGPQSATSRLDPTYSLPFRVCGPFTATYMRLM
jgi:hypothetical protein